MNGLVGKNVRLSYSQCCYGRRFESRPWHCIVGGVFPSNQATGKVFSTEYAIYSKFKIGGKVINYRPYAYPSFEIATSCKVTFIMMNGEMLMIFLTDIRRKSYNNWESNITPVHCIMNGTCRARL